MHNLTTHLRRASLFLLLSFSLASQMVIAVEQATLPIASGWLTDFSHQSVSVQVELTGKKDPLLKTVNAVLQIQLQGDWKTYWRSPGDGGAAPQFDFSGSTNIADVVWAWPAPTRYNVLGIDTLGYKGMINFPITIYLNDLSQPANLKGLLTIASCTNICVLSSYQIDLPFISDDLSVNDEADFIYQQSLAEVPIKLNPQANNQQLPMTLLNSAWDDKNQRISVEIESQVGWQSPDIFVDSAIDPLVGVTFSAPEITIVDNKLTALIAVSSWDETIDLNRHPLNFTVVDNELAFELQSTPGDLGQNNQSETLLSMFFIALLGGLILNIMPCVLPVLGMKLSAILTTNGIERSQIRKQFFASSAGIITSFWLLAGFLFTLKISGQALGWGIQFQSPYFIALMVVITALFTANMLDIFTIQLPVRTQTWLATKGAQSYLGHFLQGMFATLLATPCSAPFLGTAIAFSLASSSFQLLIIFSALGLGMALPWLLIAIFPAIALYLPKPGQWMNAMKTFFALLMLLTCYWLLTLLSRFIGVEITLIVSALLSLILLFLVAKKRSKQLFIVVLSTVLLTAIAGTILVYSEKSTKADQLQWQPLDHAAIDRQVKQGKVVFVDITADWCVTCKANKVGVLLQEPVYSTLQQEGIVAMQGDWTVASDTVIEYLQSYGLFAVPFNMVYGPGAPQGIALQTILTTDAVLAAIESAKGDK